MSRYPQQGVGAAWRALAAELQQQLREDDPDAAVEATIAPSGLLALDVRTIPGRRRAALSLARRYEARATTMCERCGGPVSVVGAGPVVTLLCAGCSTG